MAESGLLFGDEESPILSKPTKKLNFNHTCTTPILDLEQMHDRLLQHLKKKSKLSRRELTEFMEKTNKISPDTTKGRWLLMKIRGLLNYILKKRDDFHGSLLKGEITILDKSFSQQDESFRDKPEPSRFLSQPTNSEFASILLTNNDFVTMDSQMEVANSYNCSGDLFSDNNLSVLHQVSQQNYDLLKSLTSEDKDTGVMNKDKVEKALELHEQVEEEYKPVFSLPPPTSSNAAEMHNVFDNLTITNEELNEQFEELFNQTDSWIGGIINNIMCLEEKKILLSPTRVEEPEAASTLVTEYSEENLMIFKQVQNEFKKKLAKYVNHEEKADILKCLFGSDTLF